MNLLDLFARIVLDTSDYDRDLDRAGDRGEHFSDRLRHGLGSAAKAGVSGTFGDSLPIEGLIEASNETAKVGQVTGVLADALNWAGISEDEFNAKLSACSDESERNQLIMETLSGTYDTAADAFYRNNEAVIAARDNQAQLDKVPAKLGETVSVVESGLIAGFLPAISQVVKVNGFASGLVNGVKRVPGIRSPHRICRYREKYGARYVDWMGGRIQVRAKIDYGRTSLRYGKR